MRKQVVSTLGVVAMVALLGAGCQKYSSSSGGVFSNSDSGNRPFSKEAPSNDAYSSAIELDLPDDNSKGVEKDLRSLVGPIFGDVKVSSFMNNFPNESSLSVEYTTKKPTEQGNMNALLSALKDKGYTVDTSGISDGTAAISAHSGSKYLIFGFKLNDQKVSASYMSQSQN